MLTLIAALWPNFSFPVADAAFTVWFHPSRLSRHLTAAELAAWGPDDTAELQAVNHGQPDSSVEALREPQNVYYGLALRRTGLGSAEQGYRDDCVALPGYSIDVDLLSPKAHRAQNLPATIEEAYAIFKHAPDPSIVVHTGHGLHLTWCFDRPIVLATPEQRRAVEADYARFWETFHARAVEHGWQLDKTTTVQRVWRVPGLKNYKRLDDVRPVVALHVDAACRYPVETLNQTVSSASRVRAPRTVAEPPAAETANLQNRSGGGVSVSDDTGLPVTISYVPDLEPVVARLRRLSKPESRQLMARVLTGESFAQPGARDTALQRVCSIVAWIAPDHATDQLLELLRPSLATWATEPGAKLTLDEEIDKARKKLDRAKTDWSTKNKAALDALRRALGFATAAGNEEPSDEETRRVLRHLIIQYRTAYWVFDFRTNKYTTPRIKEELKQTLRDCFTADSPVEFFYRNDKGEHKEKTISQLLHEYSTVATRIVFDLRAQVSRFDPERQLFIEATAPLRPLEARHDPQIEAWLALLFGDQTALLLDWLAALTRLDEQSAAVYLVGPPGVGKGLLAAGLARLWREAGPTELKHILGTFNSDVAECPFIFLDEGLPKNVDAQDALRTLIGSTTRTLSRKFLPNSMLEGAIRLLIGANNDNVIKFEDAKGLWDVHALVERFIHVRVSEAAETFLSALKLTDPDIMKRWVQDDLIARHVVWLRENRQIIPGRRFLVEGTQRTAMHRKLVTQGAIASAVLEWLTGFLHAPDRLTKIYDTQQKEPAAVIGSGGLFVNVRAVIDCWQVYMRQELRPPSVRQTAEVLKSIAKEECRLGTRTTRLRFYRIDTATLIEWAAENQLGDEADMQARIDVPLPAAYEATAH